MPTMATSSGTGMAFAVSSARPSTAVRPTTPKTAMMATPAKRRRRSTTPDRAASAAMTTAILPSRATLSEVPKRDIAHSLTPGGTASITAPPTAVTGEREGLTSPAASSPSATPVPTATIPAAAAHREGMWVSGGRGCRRSLVRVHASSIGSRRLRSTVSGPGTGTPANPHGIRQIRDRTDVMLAPGWRSLIL